MRILLVACTIAVAGAKLGAQGGQHLGTHIVIVFDRTASFWRWTAVAHAVLTKLFTELRFTLPSSGEDLLTFVELSHKPHIVTQFRGSAAWVKGAEAFLNNFNKPLPEKGTAIVETLWTVVEAFNAQPKAFKVLLIFSDMHPDPCPPKVAAWVKDLERFDWQQLKADEIFVFLWEDQPHFDEQGRPYATVLREKFPPLRKANFVQPPPLVNGVLERRQLNAFAEQIVDEIMAKTIANIGAASGDISVPPWVTVVLCLFGVAFLAIATFLMRRRGQL
jgi:hypothetical protein